RGRLRPFALWMAAISFTIVTCVLTGAAKDGNTFFSPGNLVVSRSVYVNPNTITAGTTLLPPNCSLANCPTPVTADVDGAYPFVWNNDTVDGSFGIASKIFLDKMTPTGLAVNSLEVPN